MSNSYFDSNKGLMSMSKDFRANALKTKRILITKSKEIRREANMYRHETDFSNVILQFRVVFKSRWSPESICSN